MSMQDLVATGSEQVRAYLAAQGMVDEDITKYLIGARDEGIATFTFGPDEVVVAPRYTVDYAGDAYHLLVEDANPLGA
jgi:hypothetical protein